MNTLELKSNIHKIVETIQNEQLLQTIYDFLNTNKNNESAKLWETLTDVQKNEVLLAYSESEDENNLIDGDDIFK
jgi:hypothetical protein